MQLETDDRYIYAERLVLLPSLHHHPHRKKSFVLRCEMGEQEALLCFALLCCAVWWIFVGGLLREGLCVGLGFIGDEL